MKYSLTFAILAIGAAAMGGRLDMPWRLGMLWLSAAWLVVALAYLTRAPQLLGKQGPRLQGPMAIVCLPHLALTAALWHVSRLTSSAPAHQRLRDDVWIGRRLLTRELPEWVASVVDLTAELSEPEWPAKTALVFPILDGFAPAPEQLLDLVQQIAELPSPVFIHCAQGYGRTSMVAAALLMLREKLSVAEALQQIALVRRDAVPNRYQRRALERMALGR